MTEFPSVRSAAAAASFPLQLSLPASPVIRTKILGSEIHRETTQIVAINLKTFT